MEKYHMHVAFIFHRELLINRAGLSNSKKGVKNGTRRHVPPEAISLGAAADFIYAHIHELGYDQAHLVGHSVGGAVAVVVASRYPESVASLVDVEGNFTLKDAFWSEQLAKMGRSQAEAVLESYRADPRAW